MSLLSDKTIRRLAREQRMITPFVESSINRLENNTKVPSFGTSSYGYDLRLGRNFKIFKEANLTQAHFSRRIGGGPPDRIVHPGIRGDRVFKYAERSGAVHDVQVEEAPRDAVIDPTELDPTLFQEIKDAEWLLMPPMSFVLGHSEEYIEMPKNVTGICLGKSTWARCGMHPLTTPLEAGWKGYVTFEFVNLTGLPVRLRAGAGVVQTLFIEGDEECETSYQDRNGKYQNQPREAVTPR